MSVLSGGDFFEDNPTLSYARKEVHNKAKIIGGGGPN